MFLALQLDMKTKQDMQLHKMCIYIRKQKKIEKIENLNRMSPPVISQIKGQGTTRFPSASWQPA